MTVRYCTSRLLGMVTYMVRVFHLFSFLLYSHCAILRYISFKWHFLSLVNVSLKDVNVSFTSVSSLLLPALLFPYPSSV
jgi:hypothetical protein